MSKKMAAAWLIGFFAVLLLPGAAWAAVGDSLESAVTENTLVTQAPSLDLERIGEFPQEYESYFNSNVPFRSQLIAASSLMDVFLFREQIVNDKVVLGKDNWMFYYAEDNLEDYKGTNLFTQEELERIGENLNAARDYLEARGTQFIVLIAPNKEAVYGEEKLPGIFRKGECTRARQLTDYLARNTRIQVLYPLEELLAYKDQYDLYWHYDTHWNEGAGYIAGKALLGELGIQMPEVESLSYLQDDFSNYDLARMMNLEDFYRKNFPPEVNYTVSGYPGNDLVPILEEGDGILIYRSSAPDERKLFLLRDSFGAALVGVLARNFRESFMPHWSGAFDPAQIEEQDPDVFVLELVERRLDYLLDFRLDSPAAAE